MTPTRGGADDETHRTHGDKRGGAVSSEIAHVHGRHATRSRARMQIDYNKLVGEDGFQGRERVRL